MSLMWDVLTGKESVRTLKKQLDKELIHSVYAPRKRSKFHDIITSHHKEIDEVAINTKAAIHKVANQLDEAIKGEFRSRVEEAIESNQQKYNHL
ncbi:TPA: hypothetical protein U3R85_001423 [Streptococcus agalactiae]|nr:hypothetical protein [Streptococcus agalactiae]